VIWISTIL
jgi:hypothetical protein